jgi:hypothetical protein
MYVFQGVFLGGSSYDWTYPHPKHHSPQKKVPKDPQLEFKFLYDHVSSKVNLNPQGNL